MVGDGEQENSRPRRSRVCEHGLLDILDRRGVVRQRLMSDPKPKVRERLRSKISSRIKEREGENDRTGI